MKGIICYFSTTGNTKLACGCISSKVKNVEFELCDITTEKIPKFSDYDLVGFATYCNFWAPGKLMKTFIGNVKMDQKKPAFVFNTFGQMNGNALSIMAKDVKSVGFKLIEAHALHVPENFPPLIKRGTTNEEAPNINELEEFKVFIESIDNKAKQIYNGGNVEEKIVRGKILFKFGRKIMTSLKVDLMGEKEVHKEICTSCSLCSKGCSYGAIKMVYGHPEFDETKCESCYTCFNRCPSKVIYTKKFDGVGHYPKPHSKLVKKLKV